MKNFQIPFRQRNELSDLDFKNGEDKNQSNVSRRLWETEIFKLDEQHVRYLYELFSVFTATFSQTSVLKKVKKILNSYLRIERFLLLLPDQNSTDLRVAAASGINITSFLRQSINLDKINEPKYYPNVLRSPGVLFKRIFPVSGSLVIEPIFDSSREIAGYLVVHRNELDGFTEKEQLFLHKLMSHMGQMLGKLREFEKIEQQSRTDSLTQIPNRRYFDNQLDIEIERARRYKHSLTVLMIDIDHFKKYNDKYGHQFGDIALKNVVHCLHSHLKDGDFLARYGGEEFMVILPETAKKQGLQVAEKLRKAVEKSSWRGSKNESAHKLTISIGAASLPEDSNDSAELIRMVDDALYWAKSHGRNRTDDFAVVGKENKKLSVIES
ncbi:MAG: GGDEF domain-containing protein [Calditrichaeota bacterium]|nr:MAG: GGDEF domain-containing protein [Calditrichota bacterium]